MKNENKNKWDANKYKDKTSFVSELAKDLVVDLNPQKDEVILDLGCGDGTLGLDIQKYSAKVIGVDMSEDMVLKTKEKGIEAYVMSATNLSYENKFDAVFSNAVLHWVKDANTAIQNINRVLKSKGRFVAEFGGYNNVKSIVDAMNIVFDNHKEYGEFINPWYFPSKEEYKNLLEQYGFNIQKISVKKRPTPMKDIKDWLEIFANGIVSHLSIKQQKEFVNEVQNLLKNRLYYDGMWVIDYVRIRVVCIKC